METIKKTLKVPKNHELRIKISEDIPENEIVEIIMIFKKDVESYENKIEMMRSALNDKYFLDDLKEITEDFKDIDMEGWENNGI